MELEGYLPRIADAQLENELSIFGAVEVAGTKWCGKTWMALRHGQSVTFVDDEKEILSSDPNLALLGESPHVVDEWQLVPAIWDRLRHEIDRQRTQRGRWILTGSSTPLPRQGDELALPTHSGAGRIGRIRMWPMSLYESGDSSGEVSLGELFDGNFHPCKRETGASEIAALACRGGWPAAIDLPAADALHMAFEYIDLILQDSIPRYGKSEDTARRAITSIARNLGQAATYKTIVLDMYGAEDDPSALITEKTLADYLALFSSLYLIDGVRGWVPQARSPKRFTTKAKRYFADPSLPVALLQMNEQALLRDGQTLGLVFENLCVRDLSVYALSLGANRQNPLRYYHDDSGLEVDAIIELPDGRWGAIEIKLGENKAAEGVATLKTMRKKLCANPKAQVPEPSFMAVLTGIGTYARQVEDNIYVIPICTLKN